MSAPAAPQVETLPITDFQKLVLASPEKIDLALLGGRGGGKSHAIALLALRGAEQYKGAFKMLFVRRTYAGLRDFEGVLLSTFSLAYGETFKFNATDHVFQLPSRAMIELGQIESESDYRKYQGRSFSFLGADEVQQYETPGLLDRLRSNLRGPTQVPLRTVVGANPGDIGHQWIVERFLVPSRPWVPFYEKQTGKPHMVCPSTYRDNPMIDGAAYLRTLEAACAGDKELMRAWINGDWNIQRGAFFSAVLDYVRNAISPWPTPDMWPECNNWRGDGWRWWIAHDLGWARPSVTFVCAKSPGAFGPDGKYYAAGSIVLVDELATNVPGHLDKGLEYSTAELCEQIRTLCARWGIKAKGVADDQIMALRPGERNTYQEEYEKFRVHLVSARKGDRVSGWVTLKRLMKGAGSQDQPGLYVSKRCSYFWGTVPGLQRSTTNPEDLKKSETDHAADAARYAVLGRVENGSFSTGPLRFV